MKTEECAQNKEIFLKKKKHQHSKKYRNAIIVKNLNILANNVRNFATVREKQSQQHHTTILAELLVKIICVEYT